VENHRHAAGRQIDTGVVDTPGLWKLPFQKRDAGAAMNAGNDQVDLPQSAAEHPARQPHFLGRRRLRFQRLKLCSAFGSRRATAHGRRLPSAWTWMRWLFLYSVSPSLVAVTVTIHPPS